MRHYADDIKTTFSVRQGLFQDFRFLVRSDLIRVFLDMQQKFSNGYDFLSIFATLFMKLIVVEDYQRVSLRIGHMDIGHEMHFHVNERGFRIPSRIY